MNTPTPPVPQPGLGSGLRKPHPLPLPGSDVSKGFQVPVINGETIFTTDPMSLRELEIPAAGLTKEEGEELIHGSLAQAVEIARELNECHRPKTGSQPPASSSSSPSSSKGMVIGLLLAIAGIIFFAVQYGRERSQRIDLEERLAESGQKPSGEVPPLPPPNVIDKYVIDPASVPAAFEAAVQKLVDKDGIRVNVGFKPDWDEILKKMKAGWTDDDVIRQAEVAFEYLRARYPEHYGAAQASHAPQSAPDLRKKVIDNLVTAVTENLSVGEDRLLQVYAERKAVDEWDIKYAPVE